MFARFLGTLIAGLIAIPFVAAAEKHPRLAAAMPETKKTLKAPELDEDGFGELTRADDLVVGGPSYIIGGTTAGSSEYPWMAALVQTGFTASSSKYCGGSVIHPWWVVTAAHCVLHTPAEDIEIVTGTTDLTNLSGAQRIGVAEIIIHPDYNDYTSDSDVALLRLESPTNAQPLALIDDTFLESVGVLATVTGWGLTSDGGFGTNQLREVDVPIVSLSTANAVPDYANSLTANMLPAGFAQGGKDSCNGDSGGPLTVPSPVGSGSMLAGIVSFGGQVCAAPNVYGIYTRVSSFRNYLLGHIWPNYAAYESANGVAGELRDPDGDGWTHWDDFALPGRRTTADRQGGTSTFTFLRPSEAGEVDYLLERNANLMGVWSEVDIDANLASTNEVGDGTAWWTVNSPSSPANADFFRLTTGTADGFVSGPRPIEAPGSAMGALDLNDLEHPTLSGRRMKVYRLEDVAGGTSLAVTLRSREFDARLELLDGSGTVLQVLASDGGGGRLGQDEKLLFTASGTDDYLLRVTTELAGQTGAYQLAIWEPSELAGMPVLGIGAAGQVNGSLSGSDDLDPYFQPGTDIYHDAYRLDLTGWNPGEMVELAMDSSGGSDIDDFIVLVNAETGSFIRFADDRVGFGLTQTFNNNTSLYFLPDPGTEYIVHATSAATLDTGSYVLEATADPIKILDIALTQSVGSSFSGSDRVDEFGSYMEEFLLAPGSAGQVVRIRMTSGVVDSYLQVFDALTGIELAVDDDGGGGLDSEIDFELEAGGRYLIRASTAVPDETGIYTISTQLLP